MPRRALALVILLFACGPAATLPATAAYPDRPIRIIVPHPPGGASDTAARALAAHLSAALGQPVVVDNRPGSNGNIAAEATARAVPDGCTLMLAVDSQVVVNPHVYRSLQIDTLRDLTPIATVGSTTLVLAVHPALPVTDLAGFIAYARRARPPLAYASIGVGSMHHLTVEMLKAAAGIDLLHVPYKGGGPATKALLAGEVSVMVGGNSLAAQIAAGKARPIAVMSRQRSPKFPHLPAVAERHRGVEAQSWLGILGPAGMPDAVVALLHSTIARIVDDDGFAGQLAAAGGIEPLHLPPQEFAALIRAEHARYGAIVTALGLTLD
jgi:tripartite-type tricarboxylate transporter receptor subunit TctC